MKRCPMCHSEVPDQLEFEEGGISQVVSPCSCSVEHHPCEYVTGMAPRTDALERTFAHNVPHFRQYHLMLAHARGLEIELRDTQNADLDRQEEA